MKTRISLTASKSTTQFFVAGLVLCLGFAISPIAMAQEGVPDPVYDLAGYLCVDTGILFVQPEHETGALAELDAVSLGNGLYEFTREVDPGVFAPANFTVQHHALPIIAAATNAQPCTEEHEVYKNAYCKLEAPAVELSCIAGPNSSRITIKQRPIKRCKSPGTAYCVEVKQVNKIRETYDDSECTVLTNIEVIDRKFRCK